MDLSKIHQPQTLDIQSADKQLFKEEIPESCIVKLPEGIVVPKDVPHPFPLLSGLDPDPTTSSQVMPKESGSTANVDDVPTIGNGFSNCLIR